TLDVLPCPLANEIEIRLTNLRLMNESPNKVCACALSSFSAIFDDLIYIAFVDSSTNNPYEGFAEFNEELASSLAWEAVDATTGGWEGFVANVLNSGLSASDPVELVIRATAPPGTGIPIDSLCSANDIANMLTQSTLGTDEWDPVNQDLVGSHNSVRSLNPFLPGNSATFNAQPATYFTALDDDILNNIPSSSVTIFRDHAINVFPNPAEGLVNLELSMLKTSEVAVELLDVLGRPVQQLQPPTAMAAESFLSYDMGALTDAPGLYFFRISIDGKAYLRKVMVR
ncbi:MAG: T9SS type A sorting domain-containing protein, partial [Bacteroidota bacterium]